MDYCCSDKKTSSISIILALISRQSEAKRKEEHKNSRLGANTGFLDMRTV